MFIAHASAAGNDKLLILGLSRQNVTRLVAGQPIHLTNSTHHRSLPPGWAICLIFGETELAIKEMFEKEGFIPPSTPTLIDPRLEK